VRTRERHKIEKVVIVVRVREGGGGGGATSFTTKSSNDDYNDHDPFYAIPLTHLHFKPWHPMASVQTIPMNGDGKEECGAIAGVGKGCRREGE